MDPVVESFLGKFGGQYPQDGVAEIPLSLIRANPVALRDVNREAQDFRELRDNIKQYGVISAISLRYKPGEDGKAYELIDGLQRFTSALEAGSGVIGRHGVIPAQILNKSDEDTLIAQIVGNAQRVVTKPVEFSKAIMKVLGTNPTMTESELAAMLNKSPAWITSQLGLLKLSDAAKILVNDNKIPVASAYVLARLPIDEQASWLERAQTMAVNEFTPQAIQRSKQIRDDNRRGRDTGVEEFMPVAHLRKKDEIEREIEAPEIGPALIRDTEEFQKIASTKAGVLQAATIGFQLGLLFAINKDPVSVQAQKAKWENRKKQEKEQAVRRDAEKKEKRAAELKQKEVQAAKDADDARKAAEALPVA